jgi:hypothetical protein
MTTRQTQLAIFALFLLGVDAFLQIEPRACQRFGAVQRWNPSPAVGCPTALRMAKQGEESVVTKSESEDQGFWEQQRQLVQEMTDASDSSLRSEMRESFARRREALVGDTAYIGFFIFCALWIFSANPFVSISYCFGATLGLAYAYGLGKYVENLGGSIDDAGSAQGAGVGEARFAFLILLILLVGKFRSVGLLEIPSIAGFFTYQLSSIAQGFKEFND